MHGMIFAELKRYVVTKYGGETWNKLVQDAGLGGKVYLPTQVYDDSEVNRIIEAAVKATGSTAKAVQTDFGLFAAPELMKLYSSQINPTWKSLDLIEKTEEMVHRVVRLKIPGAKPPHLKCTRVSPKKVVIEYTSP